MEPHGPPERVVVLHLVFVSSDRSPNVMFSSVSAPACQKCNTFQMNFNNSYLSQISWIFDRCARCRTPMVWRKCRFWHVRNDTYFKRFLTISHLAIMWPSKFLLPPLVSSTFSFCIDFMVDHHDPSPSLVATFLHYLHETQMFLQCFHARIVKHLCASLAKSATRFHQHDVLQGAHVPNLLLCVAFGAPCFGTKNPSFCQCSKYASFLTTQNGNVRQNIGIVQRAQRSQIEEICIK